MKIWFDMDGTLADTLNEWWTLTDEQWVERVRTAPGMVNLSRLARLLRRVQRRGHEIGILSWLPSSGNPAVVDAKKYWLAKRLPSVRWDSIELLPCMQPKWQDHDGILFDDNPTNREEWNEHNGNGYSEKEIFTVLRGL